MAATTDHLFACGGIGLVVFCAARNTAFPSFIDVRGAIVLQGEHIKVVFQMTGPSCLRVELDFLEQTITLFLIAKGPDAIHCSTTFFYCGFVTIIFHAYKRSTKSGSFCVDYVALGRLPLLSLEQAMHGVNSNGVGNLVVTMLVDGVHVLL